jgi:Holliday junction resolvasome RuvABC endonuclease subunit
MLAIPAGNFCVMGIDQSLTGTGLCVIDQGQGIVTVKTLRSNTTGCARLREIVDQILANVAVHHPAIVAMEDVTRMASSASIIPLTELYAAIKLSLFTAGVPLRVQNQSTMKKFVFGQGDVSKDTRYMLRVFDATGIHFEDDNQADAYGHALVSLTLARVLRGEIALSSLSTKKCEALLGPAVKASGLSEAKFKKLPEAAKLSALDAAAFPEI